MSNALKNNKMKTITRLLIWVLIVAPLSLFAQRDYYPGKIWIIVHNHEIIPPCPCFSLRNSARILELPHQKEQ